MGRCGRERAPCESVVADLRPLRDAERAMSAGRGSRLSQILQYTKEVVEAGDAYDPAAGASDPTTLSVIGIGDFANALLGDHKGVQSAKQRLNSDYLGKLSFSGRALEGHISVSGAKGEDTVRLRLLLEKLDLELRDSAYVEAPPNRGLGSNNLLFMACELLLLGSEDEGFPILLIEEPEAHLHPQRQLRLMRFLQQKAEEKRPDGKAIQIIVTTHSPNLASAIDLSNLVLMHGGQAFPLGEGYTELDRSDYGFLRRFLDVTKSNLFFARGLMIVEGDAENILVPTLARLLGQDLTDHGVSLLNVGGIGLRRYQLTSSQPKPSTFFQYVSVARKQSAESGEAHQGMQLVADGILRMSRILSPINTPSNRRRTHLQVLELLGEEAELKLAYLGFQKRVAICNDMPNKQDWEQSWVPVLQSIASVVSKEPDAEPLASFLEYSSESDADGIARSAQDNIFRHPGDTQKVKVRVGSIHSVKGETHTATLVLDTFYYKHNLSALKSWLLGQKSGGSGESAQSISRLKLHYVAMTRPSHLLCLTTKDATFSAAELAILQERGWRLARVTPSGTEWL
jgi:AAA ATPase domain